MLLFDFFYAKIQTTASVTFFQHFKPMPKRQRQNKNILFTVLQAFKFFNCLIRRVFGARGHNDVLCSLSLFANILFCEQQY